MNVHFGPDTVNDEIKRIEKIDPNDKDLMAELMRDWAYSIAFAMKHKEVEKTGKGSSPVLTKFGTVENFKKYLHALAKKLIQAGYNINLKNKYIKEYFEDFKMSMPEQEVEDLETIDDVDVPETRLLNPVHIDLLEALDQLPNYVVNKGFIKIVGSAVHDGNVRDLDVYINASPDEVPDWLHKRIQVLFYRLFGIPVQIVYNNWNGPLEDYVDVYDLVLVKRISPEFAYLSKPPFKPVKPYKRFWNTITEDEIPYDEWVMQPKYNGMKVIVDNEGNTWSENLKPLPLKLDFIFKEKPPKTVYFIGEVWSKKIPRQEVIGNVKRGVFTNDMIFTAYNAVDTRHMDEAYWDRFTELTSAYLKKKYVTPSYTDLSKMKEIMKHPYYDGVVIKDVSAPFDDPKQMIKVKKEVDFDAQVMKRYKTKAGTYLYEIGFLNNGKLVSAGKTMATSEKFDVGDVIEIAPLEVTYYEPDDLIKIYVARVKGASTHEKPMTYDEVLEIAEKNGILNVIGESDDE